MKCLKPHFWYNKSQRNGVLFLVVLIIIFQIIYFFIDFSSDEIKDTSSKKMVLFQQKIDSLKTVEIENRKPKIYPFNPNYITDFKGYQLGMSVAEIDRLHKFRKQHKWINSVADFKRITKVSDSLLNKISPYFKFPHWVTNQKKAVNSRTAGNFYEKNQKKEYKNRVVQTFDINQAVAKDFRIIKGIGEKLSQRIVKYRKRLQGFSYDYQLYEVWGIDKKVVKQLLEKFKIVKKPIIQKTNINTASFKEVLRNPYIDFELCKKIFNYKDEVAELQEISELKKIKNFPTDKYDRIVLYLEAK